VRTLVSKKSNYGKAVKTHYKSRGTVFQTVDTKELKAALKDIQTRLTTLESALFGEK